MIYGYARVSTRKQLKGNSISEQIDTLINNGCEKVIEEIYTGTKVDRAKFNELLSELKTGDTLIVTKLDRFARSALEGSRIVQELIDRDVRVNILNIGIMDNTPSSKLIRHIFFAFAEFERDMIVERTQEGRAIAKTKVGYKEGRPIKYTKKQMDHGLSLLSINGGTHSYTEVAEITGISKSTLIRAVRTSRSKKEDIK